MSLDKQQNQLNDLAQKHGVELEALFIDGKNFKASYQQKKLDSFGFSNTQSLGLRVLKVNGEGTAYTESINEKDIELCFEEALTNSHYVEKDYKPEFVSSSKVESIDQLFNPDLEKAKVEDKLKIAASLESSILGKDSRMSAVPYNGYSDTEYSVSIFNTQGISASYKKNYCSIYAYGLAKDGDKTSMGNSHSIAKSLDKIELDKVINETTEKSLAKLDAEIPTSGNSAVVFTNDSTCTLLGVLSNHFSAKSVDEKSSLLTGKVGEKVFSEHISILDDPFNLNGLSAAPFDAEGSASQKTEIVTKGTLNTFLTNSVFAKKLNVTNTANASRSPSSELGVAPTNMILEKGQQSFNDLVALENSVIVIDQLKGMAGVNPISGDYSIEAEGFQYKNGKLDKALKNLVVSGNIMSTFKSVKAVGNDSDWSTGGICAPSIFVEELSIAGK